MAPREREGLWGQTRLAGRSKKYNDLAQGQARKIFSNFPVDKFYAKENADPWSSAKVRDSALKFPSMLNLNSRRWRQRDATPSGAIENRLQERRRRFRDLI